jgi:hypothetical protein
MLPEYAKEYFLTFKSDYGDKYEKIWNVWEP